MSDTRKAGEPDGAAGGVWGEIRRGIRRRSTVWFVVILVAALGADQASKAWAHTLPVHPAGCAVPADLIAHRCGGVPKPVIDGYWDWELAYNTGIAFSTFASLGQGGTQIILSLIAALALILITVMALRTHPEERWKRVAFALIAGGALGNLVDRVRDSAVTDFIRWRVHEHRWPIFNVADAVLFIGVGIMLLEGFWARRAARASGRTAA